MPERVLILLRKREKPNILGKKRQRIFQEGFVFLDS